MDEPSWRRVLGVVLAGLWLFLALKRRQQQVAEEAPAAAPARTSEQMRELLAGIQVARQIQNERSVAEPPVPTEQEMRASSRPAIHLRRAHLPVPLDHPGRSYLGGLPRMPADLAWPEKESGMPGALNFVAQIDLAGLPAIEASPLPRSGTLYFFADLEHDSPETNACRVLYYAGDTTHLPLRDMPGSPDDFAGDPRPWLATDSPWLRRNFRFPLEFVAFESVRDYLPKEFSGMPPPRNREAFDRLMAAESARLFGPLDAPPERAWAVFRDQDETWPFAWTVIEYAARTLAFSVDKIRRWHREVEGDPELQRIVDAAMEWARRAASETPHARVPDDTRTAFLHDWRKLAADLRAASTRLKIRASDPENERVPFLVAACYLCASSGAEDLIPPVYRNALAHMNDVSVTFPRHQMLGHGEKVQWAPIEYADQVLLLQLMGDDALGGHATSSCALQFWISPEALQTRVFEPVALTLECD